MNVVSRKKILFVPFDYASLREHLIVAENIKNDALYDVVFLLYRPQVITDEVKANLGRNGFKYIDVSIAKKLESDVPKYSQIISPRLIVIKDLLVLWFKALQIRAKARSMINELNVYCLVLCGDRVPGWETALVKAINNKKRASIIIQYAVFSSSGMVGYNYARMSNGGYPYRASSSLINMLAHKIVPNVSRRHLGENVLISNYVTPLAYYFSGLMPKNPWLQGGGYAKKMLVEGREVLKYYLSEGMEPEKMIVTGKPSSDKLYQDFLNYNSKLSKRNEDKDSLRVLFPLPQLWEHNSFEWDKHCREIEFMLECLTRDKKVELILSLHPKMSKENYLEMAEKYDCTFAKGSIYEEIPRCDLFVSIYSSTLTSALALGKKCVAIYYVYYYTDTVGVFDGAMNVKRVDQKQDFPGVMSEAIDEVRSSNSERNKFDPEWSVVDGKSTDRIIECIYREIENIG